MSVRFLDVARNQCRRPLSGEPGPEMMVCGAPAMPGKTHCAKCRRLLYMPPRADREKRIDQTTAKMIRYQMLVRKAGDSLPAKDIDDHIGRL